ncbi:hypothetical protein [Flexivirga oryzae]|uniref:Putative membrane protein YdfJ with MMPL/SSD domain n=1 Tax=Flexivirga oryzae TaxID=1794944 RepID=A0A839N7Y9_9MICO|nr:hypothetical protein [Flexivirga oryzae]MBB2890861.1 putative membrane protein YdfJ with MMPL/SSD domain [Flexivirga oryzae]
MSSEAAALADLRATVKWLVGSAGATAVVLVGGLQLTRLPNPARTAGIVAAVAAAVAIGLALTLLTAAARVLAVPRMTATDLSDREINAGALDPDAPARINDDVVRWVRGHGVHLLAGERTITELCSLRATAQKTARDLRHRQDNRRVDQGEPENMARVNQELADIDAALTRLEDAVHYQRCDLRFRRMVSLFPWAGALFVAAVVTFALASAP